MYELVQQQQWIDRIHSTPMGRYDTVLRSLFTRRSGAAVLFARRSAAGLLYVCYCFLQIRGRKLQCAVEETDGRNYECIAAGHSGSFIYFSAENRGILRAFVLPTGFLFFSPWFSCFPEGNASWRGGRGGTYMSGHGAGVVPVRVRNAPHV